MLVLGGVYFLKFILNFLEEKSRQPLSLAGQVSILAECREKASLGQTEEA